MNIPLIKKSRAKAKSIVSKNEKIKSSDNSQEKLSELDLSMELKGFSLSEEELVNLLQNFSTDQISKLTNNLPKSEETENQQDRN